MTREQIEKSYKNRFDADKVKNVPIDGSPTKGPEGAPITIVEFADFQCPHCGEFAPMLDKVVESRKNDDPLRLQVLPLLGKFPHSEIAARAAIAAGKQGKFWEMHHAIFANQQHSRAADLDSYAKELGLDVSRFHADMQSPETTDRIAKDRKLGEDLEDRGDADDLHQRAPVRRSPGPQRVARTSSSQMPGKRRRRRRRRRPAVDAGKAAATRARPRRR